MSVLWGEVPELESHQGQDVETGCAAYSEQDSMGTGVLFNE